MNEEKIIEGNKLIVKFMEYPQKEQEVYYIQDHYLLLIDPWKEGFSVTYDINIKNMKFIWSFDWIMDVIDKIENLQIPEVSYGFELYIRGNNYVLIKNSRGDTIVIVDMGTPYGVMSKNEALFRLVIKFINWYYKNI